MPGPKKLCEFTLSLGFIIAMTACSGGAVNSGTAVQEPSAQSDLDATVTAAPAVTLDLESLAPQRIEFLAADGTQLIGTYWPPTITPAPGVILMHMMGGSKEDWQLFAALLQGVALARAGDSDQQVRSYAVLAFDFRGHGESEGSPDPELMRNDARSALELIRTLPGIDPDRIIMIGASVGADAAVDDCTQGCIGAVSLSPGGFLGLPYNEALAALGNKPVLCVASEGDVFSADTCRGGDQVGLPDFQTHIYGGSSHGTSMFTSGEQPFLTDLIFEWLAIHTP